MEAAPLADLSEIEPTFFIIPPSPILGVGGIGKAVMGRGLIGSINWDGQG